jgi:hypothetical protein
MKFTIRDLFLVTVIVAVCLAWWLDRSAIDSELRSVTHELHRLRHDVGLEEWPSVYSSPRPLLTSQAPAPNSPKP